MSLNRFIDYVNQAPGLVAIKDVNSVIHACSPLFSQLIGYKNPDQVAGITDFELKCDAAQGAEQFVIQDKVALTRGESASINIYTYSNGNKVIMYGQKTPLIYNGEALGLNVIGHDLTHLNNMANQFLLLLENDGRFLKINAKKTASYTFSDAYPSVGLNKKESMCLFYIIRGKSNKEIAQLLHLSPRTVEGKVIEIKTKMQCDSRHQLIEKSLQKGFLEIIIKQLLFCNNLSLALA